jgi:hypothetical protein
MKEAEVMEVGVVVMKIVEIEDVVHRVHHHPGLQRCDRQQGAYSHHGPQSPQAQARVIVLRLLLHESLVMDGTHWCLLRGWA